MPHYSYLLFDADNTLFDFDAANRASAPQRRGSLYHRRLHLRGCRSQQDRGRTKDFRLSPFSTASPASLKALRENCLLIGDSPSSDIRGANNAGIPCCWYDPHGTALPEGLRIDYRITDLRQLYDIVIGDSPSAISGAPTTPASLLHRPAGRPPHRLPYNLRQILLPQHRFRAFL